MLVKCDRNLLLENINLVQKAVSSRTSLPILECFLLTCDDMGFRMMATDLELSVKTVDIPCEIEEAGAIALPSRFFSDIIRRLPDGLVTIEVKNQFVTIIQCRNTEFKIVGKTPEEFPEIAEIQRENEYIIGQKCLKNLIRQTIFSICADESKPNLMGALLEIHHNSVKMITCDTFRVSYRHDEEIKNNGNADENVIIPAKTIQELYKLLTNDEADVSVYITDKHILFDIGSCTLGSRLIEGEFIAYGNFFPQEFSTKAEISKQELLDAIDRACLVIYQEKRNDAVRIKLESNQLQITTETELGNSYDQLEIDLSGKDLEIAFNPKYLMDILKAIDEEKILMQFNSHLSPCVIQSLAQPQADSDYQYLILPVRLKG